MSELSNIFQSIANAIKAVSGKDKKISPKNFTDEISKLSYIDDTVTGKVNIVPSAKPEITIEDNAILAVTTQENGYINDGGTRNSIPIESRSEATIVPTTTNQELNGGVYLKGKQTIMGDANLVPENILRGKNNKLISIFGVKGKVDKIHRMNAPIPYSNQDIQVVDVAKSYYLAAINEYASFQYKQSKGIFYQFLTDENANCCIDCSTFGSCVTRGIDFFSSPYNGATGTKNLVNDPKKIKTLCENSKYEYADDYLDKQLDPAFYDLGFSDQGLYSIRNAAQLAEYYYCKGYTVYEFDKSPTTVPSGLKGGELIFWSKDSATNGQKSRFKAISHVAIVDRTGTAYFQVTGSESNKGQTVFYSQIKDHLEYISLIVKPNYGVNTKVGLELLPKWYYDSCPLASIKLNGTTFTINKKGGFTVSKNIPTSGTTFYIINKNNCLTLDPGTYKLSGAVPHETSTGAADTSTKWGISIKKEDGSPITGDKGNTVWDKGYGSDEFTLTEETKVYVYFYMSSNLTAMTKSYSMTPSLIRIK